uniref:Uncharacterized protein n=2 Tax=Attheya septentrionalis TaxID=420275 RepID=A0A7S2XN74_9STRA|mmetsp:Transcript_22263/g.40133  ORF Transcript_22263/g.40133 Transcript_22263/m.40133 type:complete len:184 (+) Transcript_22263:81-632(+)
MVLQKTPKKNLKRSLPSVSLSLMGCGDEVTSQLFDHWQKTPLPFIYDERLKWWDCSSDKSVMDSSENSERLSAQTGHACTSLMVAWGNDHQQHRKRLKRNIVSPEFGPVESTHISQELLQPLCLRNSTDEGEVQILVAKSQPATSALEDLCRYEEEDEHKSVSSYSMISPTAFYIMDDLAEST